MFLFLTIDCSLLAVPIFILWIWGKINRVLFTVSENDILYRSNDQIEYICVKNSFVIIGDSNGHLELINDNTSVGSVTGNLFHGIRLEISLLRLIRLFSILDLNLNI